MKLLVSQHLTHQGDLFMAMEGAAGMLSGADAIDEGRWQMEFLGQWSAKIGGGTDEIQRGEGAGDATRAPGRQERPVPRHPEVAHDGVANDVQARLSISASSSSIISISRSK
jgi:hypothetical protein